MRHLSAAHLRLQTARNGVNRAAATLLATQRHRLELLQQHIADASPQKLLAKGYSITLKDGRAVRDASELNPGDRLETRLQHGLVQSTVNTTEATE